ncbi:hypothetical protein [Paracoccus marinaquae]|uniref:Apea-like HEPN domain-containing protein n=1 Tax=Paracoccus marinaquae TaxID=2841926 RepID=A0ABS6ALD4_9RHOB|nr:hypothetical protein [Paracoccus marinaquae]MBU3031383.1 hypothetical protein [Paracoccus marinaquae]
MMIAEEQPWSRPQTCIIPNRPGDRAEQPIFTSLGQAVSDWEGVNAAAAALYRALLDREHCGDLNAAAVEKFDNVNNVHQRAKQLKDQWERFFATTFVGGKEEAQNLRQELTDLMTAYRGWAERRNDLAHGYVTQAEGPDYQREDQPIITTYALCPSHARTAKWPHSEPEYNSRYAD